MAEASRRGLDVGLVLIAVRASRALFGPGLQGGEARGLGLFDLLNLPARLRSLPAAATGGGVARGG